MKVLMSVDAVGGVWTYALELCAALARHDVDVVVAGIGPRPTRAQLEDASRLANVRVEWCDARLEWMPEPWEDVAHSGAWLRELARRERVDVVHLNGYAHGALAWDVPVLVAAHSCVCTWWRAVHGTEAPAKYDDYRAHVAAGLAAASLVVAPTHAFLARLRAAHPCAVRARVIRNGRTPSTSIAPRTGARDDILFACGRLWDESKNFELLDSVARDLPWPTYVAGDPRPPKDVRPSELHALRTLGLVTPARLARWLSRAAIFVHPARYEPFGLAVLEAALAGCALVVSDLPEMRELWRGDARFVDPNDRVALYATLDALIADPEERQRLAHGAAARAKRYRPDAMATSYLHAYRDIGAPFPTSVRRTGRSAAASSVA